MQPSPKFIFCYVGLFGWELESLVLDALAILALLACIICTSSCIRYCVHFFNENRGIAYLVTQVRCLTWRYLCWVGSCRQELSVVRNNDCEQGGGYCHQGYTYLPTLCPVIQCKCTRSNGAIGEHKRHLNNDWDRLGTVNALTPVTIIIAQHK